MKKRPVTIELKPWPFAQRPRVLIEHPDPDSGLELATALRRAGCTVAICQGPDAGAEPPTRCPLHQLEPCVVVEGADIVVTALDLDRDEGRAVLHGLRIRYPNTPLVVEATVGNEFELGDELEGCTVVPQKAKPDRVVAAVIGALPS